MKKFILIVLIGLACVIFFTSRPSKTKTILVKDKEVEVIIANTPATITKGLGGTTSLSENQGMLFIFDQQDQSRTFWMKDMVMPIDIIWIDDNKIIQIDAKVPAPLPNIPDEALARYESIQPVDYVLEVNAGWSERNNVVVGDIVDLGNLE